MKTLLMTVVLVLGITACGYKPSSHMVQNIFADTVYVEVEVDRVEPENAPYVKDEMNRLVYTRFKSRVTSKEQAESQIKISYSGSTYFPLAYENGYVTRYRAYINVRFEMLTKDGMLKKNIRSVVESNILPSSYASSALRTEALRRGLEKALDEFLSYVSVKGIEKESK